jgi:hypothetical protein
MRLFAVLCLATICAACSSGNADSAGPTDAVTSMPVTFPDGSTAELRFDPALGIQRMVVEPYQWGRIGDSMRDLDVTRNEQPARLPGIRLRMGPWHVRICDYRAGDEHAADALTGRQRRIWRTHLHGRVTPGGYLVFSASLPLRLGAATTINWGPRLLFRGRVRSMELLPGRCHPADDAASRRRASWCLSPGLRAEVAGNAAFVMLARDSLRVG